MENLSTLFSLSPLELVLCEFFGRHEVLKPMMTNTTENTTIPNTTPIPINALDKELSDSDPPTGARVSLVAEGDGTSFPLSQVGSTS